jgi:lipid-A-disaccharide synthase
MSGTDPDIPLKVYLVAGEPSGDALGARLIAALRRRTGRPLQLGGVGGPLMQAEGLQSLFPMGELAVMGLVEILPHIRALARRLDQTASDIQAFRPDVLVTIDAPGFNRRLVDRLPDRAVPRVHYVAPTVWAWRPGRVHKFRARFDRLLALLPFEPPWFEAVGLDCRFVGHSVLESGAATGDRTRFRTERGIAPDTPLLCLLPGSRRGEVTRLLPVFAEAVARIATTRPGLQVALPVAPNVAELVRALTADWPTRPILVDGEGAKFDAMAASDVALAASGTVALELALAGTPTVIAYRLPAITYAVVKALVSTKYVHLLNIMAEREIVPELIQGDCTPDRLSAAVLALIGPQGAAQVAALTPYLDRLKPPGGRTPSEAAADAVLEMVGK